jgi:hypothetical protein
MSDQIAPADLSTLALGELRYTAGWLLGALRERLSVGDLRHASVIAARLEDAVRLLPISERYSFGPGQRITEAEKARIQTDVTNGARRLVLLDRQCHFAFDGWRCHRLMRSPDETETYCRKHRTQEARDKEKLDRRAIADRQDEVVRQERTDYWKRIQRPVDPIVREEEPPILTDVCVEVEEVPEDRPFVVLASEAEQRSSAFVSWNYAVFGRMRSRRYEGYRRTA